MTEALLNNAILQLNKKVIFPLLFTVYVTFRIFIQCFCVLFEAGKLQFVFIIIKSKFNTEFLLPQKNISQSGLEGNEGSKLHFWVLDCSQCSIGLCK